MHAAPDRGRVLVERRRGRASRRVSRAAYWISTEHRDDERPPEEPHAGALHPDRVPKMGPRAVAARTFTPSEANSALERVRPLAEQMVAVRARLRELEGEQREVVKIIAGQRQRLRRRRGAHARVRAARRRARGLPQPAGRARGRGEGRRDAACSTSRRARGRGGAPLLARRRGRGRVVARPRGGLRRPEADRLG